MPAQEKGRSWEEPMPELESKTMKSQETTGRHEVTRILQGADGLSREQVFAQLAPVVYSELRMLAAAHLRRERSGHSLQPTALVNEAYLRLVGPNNQPWEDRGHFFRAAAEAMRRILIDHARKRSSYKRGGERVRVSLSAVGPRSWDEPEQVLALHDALLRLEEQDPRSAEVVQLRYFGGLSVQETAEALGLSERTVNREWTFARVWLHDALRGEHD